MTEPGTHSGKTIRVGPVANAGNITTGSEDGGQMIDISPTPWTAEETAHYAQTGETPLARLHRENLNAQWSPQA